MCYYSNRFIKVVTAYPFVIVVSSLNLSNKYAFLRSVTGIRIMNILIYVAPVVYVRYVLSRSHDISVQRLAIGCYILLYLFPVAYVVFLKVKVSTSTSQIAEGIFENIKIRIDIISNSFFYYSYIKLCNIFSYIK